MSTSSIGSTTDLAQLASRLMDSVDANKDGQLSKQEFGNFLTNLLQGVSKASPMNPSNAVASVPAGTATATVLNRTAAATTYQPIPGFDMAKMNNLAHVTTKYTFARTVQDMGLLGAPKSEHLQAIVDAMNAKGANARVTGQDKIDFGDGYGPIDVIFSVGDPEARWQWVPTT